MIVVIASLALCTSVLLLILHYRNRVEHRHGEIARLRSDFLTKLSAVYHRMISAQLHLETARLELRHMPECDDKYNSIEKMPRLIERMEKAVQRLTELQNKLERLDTAKSNRGVVLMAFQSSEHDLRTLEDIADEAEQDALKILALIRSELEKEVKTNLGIHKIYPKINSLTP